MKRYRKRPSVVEAVRWEGGAENATPIIDWVLAGGGTARYRDDPPRLHSPWCRCDGRGIVPGPRSALPCPEVLPTGGGPDYLAIDTLEGTMKVSVGDWVIRGTLGEFYPCKPDVFQDVYEDAE